MVNLWIKEYSASKILITTKKCARKSAASHPRFILFRGDTVFDSTRFSQVRLRQKAPFLGSTLRDSLWRRQSETSLPVGDPHPSCYQTIQPFILILLLIQALHLSFWSWRGNREKYIFWEKKRYGWDCNTGLGDVKVLNIYHLNFRSLRWPAGIRQLGLVPFVRLRELDHRLRLPFGRRRVQLFGRRIQRLESRVKRTMGHDGGGYSAVEYETEVLELDLMGQADVLH